MTIFRTSAFSLSGHPDIALFVRKLLPKTRECVNREQSSGQFVASPWEGLRWEPDFSEISQTKSNLMEEIEDFMASINYGNDRL